MQTILHLCRKPLSFATLQFRQPWLIFVSVRNSVSKPNNVYTQIKIDILHGFHHKELKAFTFYCVLYAKSRKSDAS